MLMAAARVSIIAFMSNLWIVGYSIAFVIYGGALIRAVSCFPSLPASCPASFGVRQAIFTKRKGICVRPGHLNRSWRERRRARQGGMTGQREQSQVGGQRTAGEKEHLLDLGAKKVVFS